MGSNPTAVNNVEPSLLWSRTWRGRGDVAFEDHRGALIHSRRPYGRRKPRTLIYQMRQGDAGSSINSYGAVAIILDENHTNRASKEEPPV